MRELFAFGFFVGKWNFALGAEINLLSFLLGVKFSQVNELFTQRELTVYLPTLSFTLSWIDNENLEKMERIHDRLEDAGQGES